MANRVTIPPGKIGLAASWFRNLAERVEQIKPQAGSGINIISTEDGQYINIEAEYTLNVCKNGEPSTLKVYGPGGQYT